LSVSWAYRKLDGKQQGISLNNVKRSLFYGNWTPMPKIAGHDVHFPHQPYGTQYSFMAKVLQTIANRENALLEAPTGSGKTLSLLCSALSWQRKLKQEG